MRSLQLFGLYFLWHYGRAFADVVGVYFNLLWFLYHFFSIPSLLLTFFSPFQRMQEGFGRRFDPEEVASVILVNLVMRVIGVVMRTVVILIGLVTLVLALVGGLAFIALWVFLPFLVVGLFFAGLILMLFPA